MRVELEDLTKLWGSAVGADSVDLVIEDGEFVAFLGPSGCGKTTTLLMVAGIYKPTRGFIRFDGAVVNHLPPKDRNIGMVFQSYALYPHMTVFGNLAFPLKLKRLPKKVVQERAQRVADMMGIGDLMNRRPGQLSGGQQQRVALGRALVKEPGLLLFDEPLSNLDARLRLTMRGEIKRLATDLGITTIYVTHDQVEAMTMADRIAVMSEGHLQAYAAPDELYDRPRTFFVASFVGNPPMSFLEVEVTRENGDCHARREHFDLIVAPDRGEPALGKDKVILGIRPEDVTIAKDGAEDGIDGEVYLIEPLGREHLVDVHFGEASLHILADPTLTLKMGQNVRVRCDPNKVQFFDPKTERSLLWA